MESDIQDEELMKKVIKDKDIIIRLAAVIGYPACIKYPGLAESVNIGATKMLSSLVSKDQLILY